MVELFPATELPKNNKGENILHKCLKNPLCKGKMPNLNIYSLLTRDESEWNDLFTPPFENDYGIDGKVTPLQAILMSTLKNENKKDLLFRFVNSKN